LTTFITSPNAIQNTWSIARTVADVLDAPPDSAATAITVGPDITVRQKRSTTDIFLVDTSLGGLGYPSIYTGIGIEPDVSLAWQGTDRIGPMGFGAYGPESSLMFSPADTQWGALDTTQTHMDFVTSL